MRLAHVTNYWPNHFGFAHYTEDLLTGIRANVPHKQFIIGEGHSAAVDNDAVQCVPAWRRDTEYVGSIVRALRQVRADVAIFQFSNDVFGIDDRFIRLLAAVERAGIRTKVTIHSVYPAKRLVRYGKTWRVGEFDRAMGEHASCLHVHSTLMKDELCSHGVPEEKVVVIPHGSKPLEARDPVASRRELGLPEDAKLVLFFGYIWLGKGIDPLLTVFSRLRRRVPNAYLLVAGHVRHEILISRAYMSYLAARLRLLGIESSARLWGGYVPDKDVPAVYSAADVVAMPYRQDYASVSGVVHQTAGIGKLMLCSRISKFSEVGELISPDLLVDARDLDGWVDGLERLLTDEPFAAEMRRRILAFAEETSWARVASEHVAVHHRLVAGKPAAARTSDGARLGASLR